MKTKGFDDLCDTLSNSGDAHPWVVITSPAAANFFAQAWTASQPSSKPRLASVGAGSAKVLEEAGLHVDFLPSKADGKTLAAELPAADLVEASAGSVLFPSSELAEDTIAEGLAHRGIRTRRINTYTTVAADWAPADLARAQTASVVAFGSPSAVRVWAERVGPAAAAVCIGESTAAEARKCGFDSVASAAAASTGQARRVTIEAWAACCAETVEELSSSTLPPDAQMSELEWRKRQSGDSTARPDVSAADAERCVPCENAARKGREIEQAIGMRPGVGDGRDRKQLAISRLRDALEETKSQPPAKAAEVLLAALGEAYMADVDVEDPWMRAVAERVAAGE